MVELIFAAKLAEFEEAYGPVPQPPTEDDVLLDQKYKKHKLKRLKQDLVLFPEVPIPKGCKLVHPMCKDPARWEGLSLKAKTDLYANKFLPYLENWKNGKAGKHAASAYGFGSYGGPGNAMTLKYPYPKHLDDDDPEMAAIDAELAESMAKSNLDNLDEAE